MYVVVSTSIYTCILIDIYNIYMHKYEYVCTSYFISFHFTQPQRIRRCDRLGCCVWPEPLSQLCYDPFSKNVVTRCRWTTNRNRATTGPKHRPGTKQRPQAANCEDRPAKNAVANEAAEGPGLRVQKLARPTDQATNQPPTQPTVQQEHASAIT